MNIKHGIFLKSKKIQKNFILFHLQLQQSIIISFLLNYRFHTGFRRRYQENIEPEYYKQKVIDEQQKEQQSIEHNMKRGENLNKMKNVLIFI